jgi:hypothetical protein
MHKKFNSNMSAMQQQSINIHRNKNFTITVFRIHSLPVHAVIIVSIFSYFRTLHYTKHSNLVTLNALNSPNRSQPSQQCYIKHIKIHTCANYEKTQEPLQNTIYHMLVVLVLFEDTNHG